MGLGGIILVGAAAGQRVFLVGGRRVRLDALPAVQNRRSEPQVRRLRVAFIAPRRPVLFTDTAAGLTVTPIFWQPVGGRYVFPPKYESIIDGYVQNVAAASGTDANVYSVDTEYYDVPTDVPTFVKYNIHVGGPVVDTDGPPDGCHPAPGYKACITDKQLRSELALITTNLDLPTDLAHFYPVFSRRAWRPSMLTAPTRSTGSAGTTALSGQTRTKRSMPTCRTRGRVATEARRRTGAWPPTAP